MTVRPDGSGYTQPTKKISFTATAQEPKPKSATRSDSKPSGLSDEDKLRIRIATLPKNEVDRLVGLLDAEPLEKK